MEPTIAADDHSPFQKVFQSIVDHAGARMVYGDPVTEGGRTIVPVAQIRYGFGGGGGGKRSGDEHGGGGGGGLVAKPLGVVEITSSGTRFVPIGPSWSVYAAVAFGVILGYSAVKLAKG